MKNITKRLNSYFKSTFSALAALTVLVVSSALSGCAQVPSPITKTGVYFDTVISITLYEKNSSELIDECFSMADDYERLFSRTIADSDVSRVNASDGTFVKISPETLYLIEKAFEYEELSGGKFSVMCGAVTNLWNDADAPPAKADIDEALLLCGKDKLEIDAEASSVRLSVPGAKLDLGAAAKGYIADKMKEHLISKGVKSGIIQLGGNVMLIGENPTKDDGMYSIGIAKPFSDTGEVITAVHETDKSIVTSGNYQRYFEYEGILYHHIIDLTTGYPAYVSADTAGGAADPAGTGPDGHPASSPLNSVTVICDSSTEADILSTVLYLSGAEKGKEILDSLKSETGKEYDAIFVDNANNIILNTIN